MSIESLAKLAAGNRKQYESEILEGGQIITFDCYDRTKMAVFFRVGAIIPVYDQELVQQARSTEDLVGCPITLRLIPGKLSEYLRYKGRLYVDDYRTHAYKQNDFADITLEVSQEINTDGSSYFVTDYSLNAGMRDVS